jgi:hypothetical protein
VGESSQCISRKCVCGEGGEVISSWGKIFEDCGLGVVTCFLKTGRLQGGGKGGFLSVSISC